ncbi:hypothetical protein L204_102699 [Cryptococcus depauperatus]
MPSKLLSLSLLLLLLTLTTQAEKTFKLTRHQTNSASSILKKIESLGESSKRDLNLNGATSHGLGYTIDVSLGGGPAIPVIIDTGSNQFWAASTTCETCTQGGMKSSHLQVDEGCKSYGLTYGIGSVQGCVSVTTMKVEEFEIDNLHVLAAKSLRQRTNHDSGLWGMARDGATVDGAPTAVSLMYSQKLIKTPTVGFYLGRESDGAESAIPRRTRRPRSNPSPTPTPFTPSSSTAISTPEPMIGEIYNALFGDVAYQYQKSYIVPCEPLSNASIAFNFGGVSFNMSPVDLVGNPIADRYNWCFGRFIPLYDGVDSMVIGDAFLHNVYHTVNVENGDVTFYGL